MKRIIDTIGRFMNGKIGKRQIKEPYLTLWQIITWCILVVLVFRYLFCPAMEAWDKVVDFLNYVIWG